MRVHSNSRFRQLTDSDMVHHPETRVLSPCTASCVLSVVYATKESRNEKIPSSSAFNQCLGALPGSPSVPHNGDRKITMLCGTSCCATKRGRPSTSRPFARDARLKRPHWREPRRPAEQL